MNDDCTNLEKLIEDSGHPVSLKASIILQRKGWHVRNAPRYLPEKDTDILKEIDIVATKKSKLIKDGANEFIIECKKQKDPWIFFKQTEKNHDIYTLNPNIAADSDGYVEHCHENNVRFQKHFYYDKELCTYFIVGGKKVDGRKNSETGGPGGTIYNAINQVFSALKFYVRKSAGDCPVFYYPIIIFDGEMYEVSYHDEKPDIKKSNHISLYLEIEFDKPEMFYSTRGAFTILESKSYIIDIVKLDYFDKFLEEIDNRM
jgi:hypothetical protein